MTSARERWREPARARRRRRAKRRSLTLRSGARRPSLRSRARARSDCRGEYAQRLRGRRREPARTARQAGTCKPHRRSARSRATCRPVPVATPSPRTRRTPPWPRELGAPAKAPPAARRARGRSTESLSPCRAAFPPGSSPRRRGAPSSDPRRPGRGSQRRKETRARSAGRRRRDYEGRIEEGPACPHRSSRRLSACRTDVNRTGTG